MNTRHLGNCGEDRAEHFLVGKGYQILSRNFAVAGGELDIIAKDKTTLVFVEVKTRTSMAFGGPLAAVTPAKQKRIALAAAQYIKSTSAKFDSIRFDIIGILPDKVEHIPNAFVPARTTL
ncbi:MAG: YraN family protein [Elusimicrobiaceae bacterium]|nr:YraN family protein [Elusimicrobiaceae bacterium]